MYHHFYAFFQDHVQMLLKSKAPFHSLGATVFGSYSLMALTQHCLALGVFIDFFSIRLYNGRYWVLFFLPFSEDRNCKTSEWETHIGQLTGLLALGLHAPLGGL